MLTTLFIILNIILLEIVLSIDNAAVLSTMVGQLPKNVYFLFLYIFFYFHKAMTVIVIVMIIIIFV